MVLTTFVRLAAYTTNGVLALFSTPLIVLEAVSLAGAGWTKQSTTADYLCTSILRWARHHVLHRTLWPSWALLLLLSMLHWITTLSRRQWRHKRVWSSRCMVGSEGSTQLLHVVHSIRMADEQTVRMKDIQSLLCTRDVVWERQVSKYCLSGATAVT